MHAVAHAVRTKHAPDRVDQLGTAQADVEIDRLRTRIEPLDMGIEEGELAAMQPDAFPEPVAEHETRIEDGDSRFGAWDKGAVDIDQDAVVAPVGHEILGSQNMLPRCFVGC